MLVWMIAAVAVCGAVSAFVLLLVGLRAVLQLPGTVRLERLLPPARVHRRRRVQVARRAGPSRP